MCKTVLSSFACCLVILVADAAEAQIVRRGPRGDVRIRAPFVRIEVGPDGRTRVRAPFTSVDEPGYRGDRIGPFQEPDVTLMDWWELRQYTREAARRLERELASFEGGARWRVTLQPGTIRDLLAEESDLPPDSATAEHLRAILASYDGLAASDDPLPVAQLRAFSDVRLGLGELVLPPQERTGKLLAFYWQALDDDLGRFATGASWQRFLRLPPEVVAEQELPVAPETPEPSIEPKQPDLPTLEKALRRYERVERTPEYRAVARLESFQATRHFLILYYDLLRQVPREAEVPRPAPRELSEPTPDR